MPSPIRFRQQYCCAGFAATAAARPSVEFALVAPMFFALLFAIIETGADVLCQPGARDRDAGFRAPDHDRSGAERGAITQAQFKTLVCSKVVACSIA